MPVPDKRELILQRLFDVGSTITEFTTKRRNEGFLKNDALPAFALLDGDETRDLEQPKSSRPGISAQRMRMSPELYILLNKEAVARDTDLGQRLNALRMLTIAALASDEQLRTLLGSNGSISYYGAVTDLKSGGGMNGQMRLDFQVKYFFDPL